MTRPTLATNQIKKTATPQGGCDRELVRSISVCGQRVGLVGRDTAHLAEHGSE